MTNLKLYETQAINHTTGEIFSYNTTGHSYQEAIDKMCQRKLNIFHSFGNNDIVEMTATVIKKFGKKC